MKLKECSPRLLTDRIEQATAKLARQARGDTVHGGCRAMVKAQRLERMGCQFPAMDVISVIYGASDNRLHEYGAYECPECGQAWLGTEKALACCQINEEENYIVNEQE